MEELKGLEPDVMPREEVFLLSSFMLNMRQAVSVAVFERPKKHALMPPRTHVEDMLRTSRDLVEHRQRRKGRRRIYAPRIKWSKWLYTGSAEDEAMPAPVRKANRKGKTNNVNDDDDDNESKSLDSRKGLLDQSKQEVRDLEKNDLPEIKANDSIGSPKADTKSSQSESTQVDAKMSLRIRGQLADTLEWMQDSDDVRYAVKLSVALFLVLWPAFVASWNLWYSLNRGCKPSTVIYAQSETDKKIKYGLHYSSS